MKITKYMPTKFNRIYSKLTMVCRSTCPAALHASFMNANHLGAALYRTHLNELNVEHCEHDPHETLKLMVPDVEIIEAAQSIRLEKERL